MLERGSFERELGALGLRPAEWAREQPPLQPAATKLDLDVAHPRLAKDVRDRIEPLLAKEKVEAAKKWNDARHPAVSGIDQAALQRRLGAYLDVPAIERAIAADTGLASFAGDAGALLALCTHQFRQKVYADPALHKGEVDEGTLDALGFIHHRGAGLNEVDTQNERFHTGKDGKGKSSAYKRIEAVYRADSAALGPGMEPRLWYRSFINPPFLGRPFTRGVHVELVRRLRLAEAWLSTQPLYKGKGPIDIGRAVGIDEDHRGGRVKDKSSGSMHMFGLAADIGYTSNPWVAGNPDRPNGNKAFKAISKRVSNLLSGTDEVLDPAWLSSLGTDASSSTARAYDAIQRRHNEFLVYMGLAADTAGLRTTIVRRQNGLRPELVLQPGESVDAAVERWRAKIQSDTGVLKNAMGRSKPQKGFLNLSRDLVVALRDHGCLAWGAIDFGPRQSGDIMHFDCRAHGIGRTLQPDGAERGHPCAAAASRELEAQVSGPTTKAHLGGLLFTFRPSALALDVAVFIPKAALRAPEIEVLVFAHGLNVCSPKAKRVSDFITGFGLGKAIDRSKRATVLVVPGLDWERLAVNKMAFTAPGLRKNRQHKLAEPATLNAVLDEVLAQVGAAQSLAAPALSRLIIAGHSRAYGFLDPLAALHADAAMTTGALAKLTHVWALDTTYVSYPKHYERWLASSPALQIEVLYRKGTKTKYAENLEPVAAKSKGRLVITGFDPKALGHCAMPLKRLPFLLQMLP